MGGSTLWLSKRSAGVWCMEHDQKWLDKVMEKDPEKVWPFLRSVDSDEYIHEIERMLYKPNLVCVDGRRRVHCIKKAISVLPSRGILLLDNSERQRYKPAIDLMKDWPQWHFDHPKETWRTSIWRKP